MLFKLCRKNLDLDVITAKLEEYESARRDLDRELQKSNWQIEI